ncbi:MAG TPA: pseudouridine synthase [Candidatus Acidoferrales bacterium]|nr:pseudouridine synthase [Candidatus Acidoferrales bacterium]
MKSVDDKNAIPRTGLARALSKLGYCSRSGAAKLIRAGRVTLNGRLRHDPEASVSGEHDQIAVDGKLIERPKRIYLMLNKPRGVVTTASDERDRETVYTILNRHFAETRLPAESSSWVAPVGRLDKASEGLLLLTNDSAWAARIAAPETHLDKVYHVQVGTVADEEFLQALLRGVRTKDREVLRTKGARRLRAGQKNCWLEIILDEGKNRQIRRMIEGMGVDVLRLIRVAIGPLQLGDLAKGEYRALLQEEKQMLDRRLREKSS